MAVNRRDLLRTGTTFAVTAGFATGATAKENDRTGDRPPVDAASRADQQSPEYANWIPNPAEMGDSAPVQAVYAGTTAAVLGSIDGTATATDGLNGPTSDDGGGPPADPILANPAVAEGKTRRAWLSLGDLGLADPMLGPVTGTQSVDPENVPTDRTLQVGPETHVYLGAYDAGAIREAVDAGPFSAVSDGTYRHDQQGTVVTWTDRAVVAGPDAYRVETVAGAGTGDVPRYVDADDDYAWLLGAAGNGGFTVVAAGVDRPIRAGGGGDGSGEDYSMFDGADGFAQTATRSGDAFASATTAVAYESSDAVRRDGLESTLGTTADDRSVRQDGSRVTIDVTYEVARGGDDAATPAEATPTATPAATDPPSTPTATDAPGGGAGDGSGEGGDGTAAPTETSGFGPGMGVLAGLASLVGAGYLAGRRSRGGSR